MPDSHIEEPAFGVGMSQPNGFIVCGEPGVLHSDPLFIEISETTTKIGFMEEHHGTNSPQHHRAIADRDLLIERWRRERKDAKTDAAAS